MLFKFVSSKNNIYDNFNGFRIMAPAIKAKCSVVSDGGTLLPWQSQELLVSTEIGLAMVKL